VLVVDASVLVVALADDGADGDRTRARLAGEVIAAPEVLDLEVLSVLRRLVAAGDMPERRASLAVEDLARLPLRRAPHTPLLARCWELRGKVTSYDAAYVALAEALGCILLTADTRLAAAPGPHCVVEVVT
jgi:predicted nucleic acid-binding protein